MDTQELDKLLNGAIEFDNSKKYCPKRTQNRIKTAKTTQKNLQKLIADAKESIEFGIVPTKYVQPDENGSMLQRALKITSDYEETGDIAETVDFLVQLTDELGVEFRDMRAEDGQITRNKQDARINPKIYQGKKYLSRAQKTAIRNLYMVLNTELKDLDIQKAKKATEIVEKFYQEHKVYTVPGWSIGSKKFTLQEDSPKQSYGFAIRYKPFKQNIALAEELQKGNFVKINQIRERLTNLKHNIYTRHNIDQVLADEKTMLTTDAIDAINSSYEAIAEETITEGLEEFQKPNKHYFDVVVSREYGDDAEDHRIRAAFGKKRNNKSLLKWTPEKRVFGDLTIEPHEKFGTWYGRGRTRDYVEKLCAKADEQGDVYLKIVAARR